MNKIQITLIIIIITIFLIYVYYKFFSPKAVFVRNCIKKQLYGKTTDLLSELGVEVDCENQWKVKNKISIQ